MPPEAEASGVGGRPGSCTRFVGVDVQVARGCPYAVLDEGGGAIDSGWVDRNDAATALAAVVRRHGGTDSREIVAVGIDAPRVPLPESRQWFWKQSKGSWGPGVAKERGHGRHCEVVIAAHRLANPQWTPVSGSEPEWMRLGYELFESLKGVAQVFEVFPSASYAMLAEDASVRLSLSLRGFARGPKDMLDAHVAAVTVREYAQGRGCAVGGGDGLGAIILPRPLDRDLPGVLAWPGGASPDDWK